MWWSNILSINHLDDDGGDDNDDAITAAVVYNNQWVWDVYCGLGTGLSILTKYIQPPTWHQYLYVL